MITRTLIQSEIDNLRDEDLDIVYSIIKSITKQYDKSSKQTFMSKLKSLKIQGPEDFSRNIDFYLKQQEKNNVLLCLPEVVEKRYGEKEVG